MDIQVLYPLVQQHEGNNCMRTFLALRLKNMQSQLSDLSHQINEVKGKASTYKQRLEKKCCDLQKAETEVSHDCPHPSNVSFMLYKLVTIACVCELFPYPFLVEE